MMYRGLFIGFLFLLGFLGVAQTEAKAQHFVPGIGYVQPRVGNFGPNCYGPINPGFVSPFAQSTIIRQNYFNPVLGYGYSSRSFYSTPFIANPYVVRPAFNYGYGNFGFVRPGISVGIGFGRVFP